jgi:hypothetical protein
MLTVEDIEGIARVMARKEADRVREEIIALLRAKEACRKAKKAWIEANAEYMRLDTAEVTRDLWEGWHRKTEALQNKLHEEKQKERAAGKS